MPHPLSLADHPQARRVIKIGTVMAEFAEAPGVIDTLEGTVPYDAGDAILTGVNGERWPVVRAKFNEIYEPVPDQTGRWRKRNKTPVLALQQAEAFEVSILDGKATLSGKPGDWLVEYGPGDQAVVSEDIFGKTYKILS